MVEEARSLFWLPASFFYSTRPRSGWGCPCIAVLRAAAPLLLAGASARAWLPPGHSVIAARAYQDLSPAIRAKALRILKEHPAYGSWTNSFVVGTPRLDLGLYVFMRASGAENESHSGSSTGSEQPHWHVIEYPLVPPNFPFEAAPRMTNDLLSGIAESERVLADAEAPPAARALSLSSLIHLIGDLHQPLDCVALVNRTYPAGDKGGREFYVNQFARATKLHRYWDGLLGRVSHAPEDMSYAFEIGLGHPRDQLSELAQAHTAKDWSLESRGVAIEKVYLSGNLPGSTNAATAPALPEGYAAAAKAVAERQAALAGYRLADDLRRLLE